MRALAVACLSVALRRDECEPDEACWEPSSLLQREPNWWNGVQGWWQGLLPGAEQPAPPTPDVTPAPSPAPARAPRTAPKKVVLIGDTNGGKTALLRGLRGEEYSPFVAATVGVDLYQTTFHVEGEDVRLLIWDTGGLDRFRDISRGYLRNADGYLLAYDCSVTIAEAYGRSRVVSWLSDAQGLSKPDAVGVLVAMKADLPGCALEDGRAFAEAHGLGFVAASAVRGEGLREPFEMLASALAGHGLLARAPAPAPEHGPFPDGSPRLSREEFAAKAVAVDPEDWPATLLDGIQLGSLMYDPVEFLPPGKPAGTEAHFADRAEAERWLRSRPRDPWTNLPMTRQHLKPRPDLQQCIHVALRAGTVPTAC